MPATLFRVHRWIPDGCVSFFSLLLLVPSTSVLGRGLAVWWSRLPKAEGLKRLPVPAVHIVFSLILQYGKTVDFVVDASCSGGSGRSWRWHHVRGAQEYVIEVTGRPSFRQPVEAFVAGQRYGTQWEQFFRSESDLSSSS